MADITESEAYKKGFDWANKNSASVAELYSSRELLPHQLRSHLFTEADKFYPPQRDSAENDVFQVGFVAGAVRALVDRMPLEPEVLREISEAAMDLGAMYSSLTARHRLIEELKLAPPSWWDKKVGDTAPREIIRILTQKWRREFGRKEKRMKPSLIEVLLQTLGPRELEALLTVEKIRLLDEGEYARYRVEGPDNSFEIMAKNVIAENGVVLQAVGDLVA